MKCLVGPPLPSSTTLYCSRPATSSDHRINCGAAPSGSPRCVRCESRRRSTKSSARNLRRVAKKHDRKRRHDSFCRPTEGHDPCRIGNRPTRLVAGGRLARSTEHLRRIRDRITGMSVDGLGAIELQSQTRKLQRISTRDDVQTIRRLFCPHPNHARADGTLRKPSICNQNPPGMPENQSPESNTSPSRSSPPLSPPLGELRTRTESRVPTAGTAVGAGVREQFPCARACTSFSPEATKRNRWTM